jgi:hypothetical protein
LGCYTDVVRFGVVDEAGRLLAVDALDEVVVQKCVVDVHLVHRPVTSGSNGENSLNGGILDDGTEGLVEVHARALGETADDPARFVPFEGAVGVEFVPEVKGFAA